MGRCNGLSAYTLGRGISVPIGSMGEVCFGLGVHRRVILVGWGGPVSAIIQTARPGPRESCCSISVTTADDCYVVRGGVARPAVGETTEFVKTGATTARARFMRVAGM